MPSAIDLAFSPSIIHSLRRSFQVSAGSSSRITESGLSEPPCLGDVALSLHGRSRPGPASQQGSSSATPMCLGVRGARLGWRGRGRTGGIEREGEPSMPEEKMNKQRQDASFPKSVGGRLGKGERRFVGSSSGGGGDWRDEAEANTRRLVGDIAILGTWGASFDCERVNIMPSFRFLLWPSVSGRWMEHISDWEGI